MREQIDGIKRLFISATYNDQKDCIEEVKSKLGELGVEPYHFKEGHFYNGRIDVHSHDRCIEMVRDIPNYLLIVSFKAGTFYAGENVDYRDLTVTHAEFKAALDVYNDNRKLFPFVRREVWDYYNIWKLKVKEGDEPDSWEIDRNLFPLLEDVETNIPWTDTFDTSLDLKQLISQKIDYFV